MNLFLLMLVTFSACGALSIRSKNTQDDPMDPRFFAPLQPPIWQSYAQYKHLRSMPKNSFPRCSVSSKDRDDMVRRTATSHWDSRKLPETVSHIRKITGKTEDSEVVPESLRNVLDMIENLHKSEYQQHPKESPLLTEICPSAEEILPCQCDSTTKEIDCSAITNLQQLQEIFHTGNFPIQNYEAFIMIGSEFSSSPNQSTLTDNIFGSISFVQFRIEETMVQNIMDNAFSGSEDTLKKINFMYNYHLTYFPFEQMIHFPKLEMLSIEGSPITTVPLLSHMPNLGIVFLDENKIANISPMAFADLPVLQVLDLGGNMLENINGNVFKFSSPSAIVYLDSNYINLIDEKAFSGKQPVLLDVSNNCLASLDENVFTPILDTIISNEYNTFVRAEDNPLKCNSIEWLLKNPVYLMYFLLSDPSCSP